MKFVAKKYDLDLELVTTSGETVEIKGPETLSGRQAGELANRMNSGGLEFDALPDEDKTPLAIGILFGEQLSWVYTTVRPEWWVDNIDLTTIKDIRDFVIQTLLGAKKN